MILFDLWIRRDETEVSASNRHSMGVHYSHRQEQKSRKMSHYINGKPECAVIAHNVRDMHMLASPNRAAYLVQFTHKFITGYV